MAEKDSGVERYPKDVQESFRPLILEKIKKAKKTIEVEKDSILNPNGTDDTYKDHEVIGSAKEKGDGEINHHLISRQEKLIRNLENALLRIENGTFGTCRITGGLISLDRLKCAPHATTSIEGKEIEKKTPGLNGKEHHTVSGKADRKLVQFH